MTAQDGAPPSSSAAGPSAPPSADAVRDGLDELAGAAALAHAAVDKGAYVDLGGMDRRVEALCGDLSRLPAAEAKALEPVLAELIGTLDTLAQALSGQNADAAPTAAGEPVDDRAAAEAAARARARAAYRGDR